MDRPQLPSLKIQPQTRLLLTITCILLGGLLLASIYLSFVTNRVAQQQVREQGNRLAQQTVNLLRPALLAADPVSLNFVLNQQTEHPSIDAIILKDTKNRLLGRAGQTTSDNLMKQEITISQQDQPLAFLELHLNPEPYHYQLSSLMIQTLILALIVIIITLLAVWQLLKRSPAATELPTEDPAAVLPPEVVPLQPEKPSIPDVTTEPEQKGQDDLLVDLLKPADDAPEMPGFAPFSDQKKENDKPATVEPDKKPIIEEVSLEIAAKPETKFKNPLFELDQDKHEVQLDLYSFEQELELIVAADQAGYLLYLDLASGHSDNITPAELEEMQEYYSRMLDMVIAIYQGEMTKANNGDLQLAFLKPHKDDSHGVNAICASQLFNRLYKLFNQQRIRQMKPVLNLHMALVRGHHKKQARLQEEARYLTQSTESNELITHTALSEAPDLKVSLLAGADIQRAEEDKVLIMSVNDNYQKLLDKQARHLLKKLFP